MKKNFIALVQTILFFFVAGCASLPSVKHDWAQFPKEAMVGIPKRPYKALGVVRSTVEFPTLDAEHNEDQLCRNYYNKAVKKLVEYAKDNKGDAVIEVRSVVMLVDGQMEMHETPECADEGGEGQVLTRGIAVKWLTPEEARIQALEEQRAKLEKEQKAKLEAEKKKPAEVPAPMPQ